MALRKRSWICLELKGLMSTDRTIENLRPQIAAMADERHEPKSLCWIENQRDGEQSESYYCYDCAERVIGWLLSGKHPKNIDKYATHPDWKNLRKDDLWITDTRGSYETEGCEHCEVCGCQLSVCLLDYGVQFEIEHYEEVEAWQIGSRDFWCWLDVLDGIDYVEKHWFPGDHKPDEAKRSRELYRRAIKITEKFLGIESN